MRVRHLFLMAAVSFAPSLATAQTSDPVAARGHLQQGFALKEQGKCNEAIPHFVESLRLDRQPKALLNLADCEEKVGKLGAAQTHFVEAREVARAQGLEPLRGLAEQHLQAIEKRMPKLAVKLGTDAPGDTTVTRDGMDLGSVSLNSQVPIDVGKHVIIVRGGGFQRQYEVTIAEGETKGIIVTPLGGQPVAAQATPTASAGSSPPSGSPPIGLTTDSQARDGSIGSGQRIAGFSMIGAGVVGLAVGTIFGLKVSRKNDEIDTTCPTAQPCPPDGVVQYNTAIADAKIARAVSLVGLGAGAIFVGVGTALVLTAPKSQTPRTALWVRPAMGPMGAGAAIGGTW